MIGWMLGNLKAIGLAAGGLLISLAIWFIRKGGADAERLKQAKADVKAAQTVAKARTEAKGASDAELDKKVDKWTRK
jgi:hypothetical protein